MSLFTGFIFLLFLGNSCSQRLSTGASDWYMRFKGMSTVKRAVDDPIIYAYHVTSTIRHRYAVTEVKSTIYNPANIRQVYRFGLVMPKTAFVSNVTLISNNETLSAMAEANWKGSYASSANGNGHTSHRHHPKKYHQDNFQFDFEDFQQFILPIYIQPNENVTIILVYEDLLCRRFDKYVHSLSISPGNIVSDFQIKVSIKENRPLIRVNFFAPVIGNITNYFHDSEDPHTKIMEYKLNAVQQYDYFGNHGFAGVFKAEYDAFDSDQSLDVIFHNNLFVHFYDHPTSELKSIPKHIIVLLDTSESMSGPKLDHAKKSISLLLENLNEKDFINLFLFNKTVYEWHPDDATRDIINNANGKATVLTESFTCNSNITRDIVEFVNQVNPSGLSDLASAIVHGMYLDKRLWVSNALPENAHTMMVVVTDGRSPENHSDARKIRATIRKTNQLSQIPILILGMGFDADMDFLEKIAETSNGYAENIIEDLDVEPQLQRIKMYLNDVILKNLQFRYVDDDVFDKNSITVSTFKYFHKGGSVIVAGKFNESLDHTKFEVEITGQSADGLYTENHPAIFPSQNTCDGQISLCSETEMDCIVSNVSISNLNEHGVENRVASINVTGDCLWIAYSEPDYSGNNWTITEEDCANFSTVHGPISSVRRTSKDSNLIKDTFDDKSNTDSISRLWAYLAIEHFLKRLQDHKVDVTDKEISVYSDLALKYHFLTPFTDLRLLSENGDTYFEDPDDDLVEPDDSSFIDNDLLTYKDLSPVLSSLKDPMIARQWQSLESCHHPIKCVGNFHVEELLDPLEYVHDTISCSGNITLFTKTNFEGESLRLGLSIFQLYHTFSSQRFRSVISEGNCCWLLFDKRFFAGDVEKICGSDTRPLRMKNIGSIKRIASHSNNIK